MKMERANLATATMKRATRVPIRSIGRPLNARSFRNSSNVRRLPSKFSMALKPLASKLSHSYRPRQQLLQRRLSSDDASTSEGGLSRTALHELHVEHGGKMVPFGGYSMPVQYSDLSVGESHKWTREKASLFDVGHMYASLAVVMKL